MWKKGEMVVRGTGEEECGGRREGRQTREKDGMRMGEGE